jgi:ParB/RepB/Spo0J family partition protein
MAATAKNVPTFKVSEQAKAAEQSERIEIAGQAFAWFGWKTKHPSPPITDNEASEVDAFLYDCENDRFGTIPTPSAIWRFVDLPSRVEKHFRTRVDAMAMAMALIPDSSKYLEWIAEQGKPSEHCVAGSLADLPSETQTPFGTVLAELKGESVSIWFGRKAGQQPALRGSAAVVAVKCLFNITDQRPEHPATTSKTKQLKMVAKKETPTAANAEGEPTLRMVRLSNIQPAKQNHRKTFDKAALTELADSIKAHGVLQPLLLRPLNDIRPAAFFVIIAGERRYRAALLAGLKEVPAQIVEREGVSESLAMLHENIMRVDLNPIERAQAIRRLMDEHSLSQKQVGDIFGCGQGQISNELRLLNLPESLQAMVAAGTIAPTLIRVVLPWSDIAPIMEAVATTFKKRIDENDSLNVPDAECILDECVDKASRSMSDRSKDPVSEWMKPSKDLRYFGKVDPEKLKALDVREVKHRWGAKEERAFNIPLFHELNREPLKKRMEKYNELQKKKGKTSKEPADKSLKPFDCSEYPVQSAIANSLTPLLANVLETAKDKAKVRTVCQTLICLSECIAETLVGKYFGTPGVTADLLQLFTASDCDKKLRDKLVAELRGRFHLDPEESIELAKHLGADLMQLWKPTDELVQLLTDHGRELLAAAAGSVPEFLLPFFGVEATKTAKAKKSKAA